MPSFAPPFAPFKSRSPITSSPSGALARNSGRSQSPSAPGKRPSRGTPTRFSISAIPPAIPPLGSRTLTATMPLTTKASPTASCIWISARPRRSHGPALFRTRSLSCLAIPTLSSPPPALHRRTPRQPSTTISRCATPPRVTPTKSTASWCRTLLGGATSACPAGLAAPITSTSGSAPSACGPAATCNTSSAARHIRFYGSRVTDKQKAAKKKMERIRRNARREGRLSA
jgi:hypothetical protein